MVIYSQTFLNDDFIEKVEVSEKVLLKIRQENSNLKVKGVSLTLMWQFQFVTMKMVNI